MIIKSISNESFEVDPQLCYFGQTVINQEKQAIGLNQSDRRNHMYILGKTGMGKTNLLQNMVLQDINNGLGVAYFDPHGDSAEYLLDRIPKHRWQDVIYLNPVDKFYPIGLNVLEAQNGQEPFLISSNLMAVFSKLWSGLWSTRMEYILSNTLLALAQNPGSTLLHVVKMLTDEDFQRKIVVNLKDPLLINFWVNEYQKFNDRYRQEAVAPILNKIGQFFSSEPIRNILGQVKSTINLREIMDKGKILIVNLSIGSLGEDNSNLFGSLLLSALQTSALSRSNQSNEKDRKDFYIYVDEFQNFTTKSFEEILSEARKYRLCLILAHQYISQLSETSPRMKNAIFGNVGTIIAFRIGSQDAKELSSEFNGFSKDILINQERSQIVVKMSVNGKPKPAFQAYSLPPLFHKLGGNAEIVRNLSRHQFSGDFHLVTNQIQFLFQIEVSQDLPNSSSLKKNKKNQNLVSKNKSSSNQTSKSDKESIQSLAELKSRILPVSKIKNINPVELKKTGNLGNNNPVIRNSQKRVQDLSFLNEKKVVANKPETNQTQNIDINYEPDFELPK